VADGVPYETVEGLGSDNMQLEPHSVIARRLAAAGSNLTPPCSGLKLEISFIDWSRDNGGMEPHVAGGAKEHHASDKRQRALVIALLVRLACSCS
jgi:hypothetical protein